MVEATLLALHVATGQATKTKSHRACSMFIERLWTSIHEAQTGDTRMISGSKLRREYWLIGVCFCKHSLMSVPSIIVALTLHTYLYYSIELLRVGYRPTVLCVRWCFRIHLSFAHGPIGTPKKIWTTKKRSNPCAGKKNFNIFLCLLFSLTTFTYGLAWR